MVRSCFFFGASTLAFAALAASYYGDSDYNPRIISILPQSDQALREVPHYVKLSNFTLVGGKTP